MASVKITADSGGGSTALAAPSSDKVKSDNPKP